ncbi:hypothetical protein OOA_09071 [Providencia burhodogranariea DSM 19968]|uniref:SPOR domain-containing protein n=2 Tax=Providencia burhodogranariea TaxID=516074 RepID=K8WQ09_9GAMM|nr:SPOR domain-containing protein [Providencia burhodogranariea]EKT62031.1 hypothetical protein OOA_09071 [Providencia burhodogranariea DSM 19968]
MNIFFLSFHLLMGSVKAEENISNIEKVLPSSITSYLSECFIDKYSESLCWQQMREEPDVTKLYDFGVHYANGDGVQQNNEKGRYWIQRAALGGYPLAQYNLGVMFYDGIGGIQSRECAHHWLNKVADETGDTGLMAQQALAAMVGYEVQFPQHFPKVYRVLTTQECEQLTDVAFPTEKLIEPILADNVLDFDPIVIFKHGLDGFIGHANQLPVGERLESLPIETILKPESRPINEAIQPATRESSHLGARKKMGHYLVSLGQYLLGQTNEISVNDSLNPVNTKDTAITLQLPEPLFDALPNKDVNQMVGIIDIPIKETAIKETPNVMTPVPSSISRVEEKRQQKSTPSLNLGGALRHASKRHYTLQLSSASRSEPLLALAKKQKLSNYLVYETERHGVQWYVLVYGEYVGMTQAKQALQQLPATLQKDLPWIRSISDIQAEIK